MKRETFRLANVLRVYELRKQQSEMALSQASQELSKIDGEIAALGAEIDSVAVLLERSGSSLSMTAWLGCYRKTDQLDRLRGQASERRVKQTELMRALRDERKKWAISEEALLTLQREIEARNRAEAAKEQQLQLDEAVLRRLTHAEE